MKLTLTRTTFTDTSTIGELYIDGAFECFVLEDMDRGLSKHHPPELIKLNKIHGVTAIPAGEYEIVKSFSNRFQRETLELKNVPGYAGIRIHAGNTDKDSDGCLIPGLTKATNFVGSSKAAFAALEKKIFAALENEDVWISIEYPK